MVMAAIAILLAVWALIKKPSKPASTDSGTDFTTRPLQLQAYERLVVLTERISLPNLISRVSQPNLSVREMQLLLIENIKQEFDYNLSQQVYVTVLAWDAVRNLRDQNLLIINHLAGSMPADARATELNKALLEIMMNQQEKALHSHVLETLNLEAKKLMR